MKLKGKTAIVTGASSGMGREIAYQFAREGADVLAVARRAERLKTLVEEAQGFEGRIVGHLADLTDPGRAGALVNEAVDHFGRLDILVNNAGIMDDMSGVGSVDMDMYEKVFAINVKAPMVVMKAAVNYFLKIGGGVIVNIASIGGLNGGIAGVVYTASKHALVGISRNTAFMYGPKGIRCNTICPGAVNTEVGSGEFMKAADKAGQARLGSVYGLIPRSAEASEIASIAVFLACDESTFINGQNIVADGGWTAAF